MKKKIENSEFGTKIAYLMLDLNNAIKKWGYSRQVFNIYNNAMFKVFKEHPEYFDLNFYGWSCDSGCIRLNSDEYFLEITSEGYQLLHRDEFKEKTLLNKINANLTQFDK